MRKEVRKKEKENFLKASITVEASYIVPIMIFIIFAVMVISFYFYDTVTAKTILQKNIVQLQNIVIHPLEQDSYYYDYSAINERFLYSFFKDYQVQENMGMEQIEQELISSLMLLHPQNIDVQIKDKKLTASIELYWDMALPGIQYIPFFGRIKKVIASVSVYNQSDFIRILTIIDNGT